MKTLKIILLFDVAVKLDVADYADYWNTPDWKSERDVKNTLIKLLKSICPRWSHT